MTAYAFCMRLKPGREAEYARRHDAIWPEMSQVLIRAGIRNYHIFQRGQELFAFLETNDFDNMLKVLTESEVNARWGQYMSPIVEFDVDPATAFPVLLPCVFEQKSA